MFPKVIPPRLRAPALRGLFAALAATVTACSPASAPDPSPPAGLYLEGDGSLAREVLRALIVDGDRVAQLTTAAGRAHDRIAACPRVTSHLPQGGLQSLIDAMECMNDSAATAFTPPGALQLWLPRGEDAARTRIDAHLADGNLHFDIHVPRATSHPMLALLRSRADAVDLPWTIPAEAIIGGAGHLESVAVPPSVIAIVAPDAPVPIARAATAAALTGAWAFWALPGTSTPESLRIGLALEFTGAGLLRRGLDTVSTSLQKSYGITMRRSASGDGERLCAAAMNLVPGFRPCVAVRGRWLSVGWNADALLPVGPQERPATIDVDFTQVTLENAKLAKGNANTMRYPFARVRLTLARDDATARLSLTPAPKNGGPP